MKRLCKKCNREFDTVLKINGKRHQSQGRKHCYNCSPYGTKGNLIYSQRKILNGKRYCNRCQRYKSLDMFYKGHVYCKSCCNKITVERQKNRKRAFLNLLGGKCLICGYDKYDGALEFHHIDPTQKEFNINKMLSIRKVQEEIKKCIILCSNCHREIHGGVVNLENKLGV